MLFQSPEFLLCFLPICLVGFFLAGRHGGALWAVRWVVVSGLVFYGCWDVRFVPLLIGSVLVNFALTRLIRRAPAHMAKTWLIVGIALNLIVLVLFRYAVFLTRLLLPDQMAPDFSPPLGLSFFTFQQIMLLTETWREPGRRVTPTQAAAFILFFPHLIAGPLVRPREILPQLADRALARPNGENLSAGLAWFLLGLGKKLVLADNFGTFADVGFNAAAAGATLTLFEAWSATLAYALQIYFDFSGYSDMAIGLARMMNVRFPLNFDSPYQAKNITDFWRRWHITLGLFLRDHVYIPLGGSRHGQARWLLNLMATMLLCGLWHGPAWRFVLWGGLHGLFLAVHALFRARGFRLPSLIGQALTLAAVVVAWVPFRADSLAACWSMLRAMAGMNGAALPVQIVDHFPLSRWIATPVALLPYLGDARTLSVPEVMSCLLIGWIVVLGFPNSHTLSARGRQWALTAGFALTVQAVFFAPRVAPFLYFQF